MELKQLKKTIMKPTSSSVGTSTAVAARPVVVACAALSAGIAMTTIHTKPTNWPTTGMTPSICGEYAYANTRTVKP